MKLHHLFCLSATLFLLSCKKEKVDETVTEIKVDTITKVQQKSTEKELEKLTSDFIKRKQEIQEKLKKAAPLEANALYEALVKENGAELLAIEKLEEHFINNYYSYFYNEEKQITPPDSIQKKVDLLTKTKLEVWDVGEGIVEIRTLPSYYIDIFKSRVTEDYKEFIAINAEEDKELFVNDAALAVELGEAGRRVINWEKFIAKYPDSKLIERAKSIYLFYQDAYLFGFDNTPVKDYQTRELYKENLDDFKKFVAKYPESPTTRLIQIVINNTGTHDELSEIINKEQQNMGLDTTPYGDSE
ncbi:hypothetical protein AAEO56_07460 [Flavobacterium sp. DGU11]|uniref:Beta-barrel assembly machine subunit BamD n=1 Tax=Flavobacterium arundinis TaxID=3139143 RepID=A0ABU9HW19_9FLAO